MQAPGGFEACDLKWKPLTLQLGSSKGSKEAFFGPELSLAATLLRVDRLEKEKICIAKFGVGSSAIKEWLPQHNNSLYPSLLSFCHGALSSLQEEVKSEAVHFSGLVWLQGESDSSSSSSAKQHAARVHALITQLRQDLNSPQLPAVVGQVVWSGKHLETVNRNILQLCGEPSVALPSSPSSFHSFSTKPLRLANSTWTSSVALPTLPDGHLSAAASQELGIRMAEALCRLWLGDGRQNNLWFAQNGAGTVLKQEEWNQEQEVDKQGGVTDPATSLKQLLARASRFYPGQYRRVIGSLRDWPRWAAVHPHTHSVGPAVLVGRNCMGEAAKVVNHTQFSMMTWNILSDEWLRRSVGEYDYVPGKLQMWAHRLACLRRWVELVRPCVLLLQEMDYAKWGGLLAELRPLGYEGISQRGKHQAPDQPCGLATLWRTDRLTLSPTATPRHGSRTLVVSLRLALPSASAPPASPALPASQFRCVEFAVVNVHLEASQQACGARARQISGALLAASQSQANVRAQACKSVNAKKEGMAGKEEDEKNEERTQQGGEALPGGVVLGGDFNTGADSALLEALRDRQAPWHGLSLASVYEHPAAQQTLPASCSTFAVPLCRFMIDHILYSHDSVTLSAIWDPLTPRQTSECLGKLPPRAAHDSGCTKGLPNALVPSDHLPIGAILQVEWTAVEKAVIAEAAQGPVCPALPRDLVGEERRMQLRAGWAALQAEAPARPKGKPSAALLSLLQAHAAKCKEWKKELDAGELDFVKSLKEAAKSGKPKKQKQQNRKPAGNS